jgi:hypothetical protein
MKPIDFAKMLESTPTNAGTAEWQMDASGDWPVYHRAVEGKYQFIGSDAGSRDESVFAVIASVPWSEFDWDRSTIIEEHIVATEVGDGRDYEIICEITQLLQDGSVDTAWELLLKSA